MITCENSSGSLKEAIKVKTEPSECTVNHFSPLRLTYNTINYLINQKVPMIGNRITFVRSMSGT